MYNWPAVTIMYLSLPFQFNSITFYWVCYLCTNMLFYNSFRHSWYSWSTLMLHLLLHLLCPPSSPVRPSLPPPPCRSSSPSISLSPPPFCSSSPLLLHFLHLLVVLRLLVGLCRPSSVIAGLSFL